MTGGSGKPKTAMIIGIVGSLFVILLGGFLLLFLWKGRHKSYRREVFVDVAG